MTQPSPQKLTDYLNLHFPDKHHYCVYEAGFTGFWVQEELQALGVKTIIVNPADVPTTDKDKRTKTDKIDCKKLALGLASGFMNGIHIPPKQQQRDRSLVRQRYQYASDERRMKNRIKSHLDFFGLNKNEVESSSHWSNRYIKELEKLAETQTDIVLEGHLMKLRNERHLGLTLLRRVRELSKSESYAHRFKLLNSIPGVGLLTAMVYLTEIGDIHRFKKDDHYISYIGLVPNIHASGEKEYRGRLSKRGNKRLRTALILSSWMAIRNDVELLTYYENSKSNGKHSNVAIVKVARKLALIMKAVIRDNKPYEK
jgi:transposase